MSRIGLRNSAFGVVVDINETIIMVLNKKGVFVSEDYPAEETLKENLSVTPVEFFSNPRKEVKTWLL